LRVKSTTRRGRALLTAALFFALAGSGSHAHAQSTTTQTNETIPFTSTLTNPCNGDLVTFQGNMHATSHVTFDASGGYHLKTHVNYQNVSGRGIPSGNAYNVRTTTNETVNDNDGPQFETTVIQNVKLITQGPALNYFLQIVFHVTVNANGQTTSTVEEAKIQCRGNGGGN
jgi:hypothetical protein